MGVDAAQEAVRLPGSARPEVHRTTADGHGRPAPHANGTAGNGHAETRIQLCLMQGFSLSCDREPISIPLSAQRVAAFVALRSRPALRGYVAEMLWLDATQDRAMGNLRSALWRLRQAGAAIVETSGDYLSLARDVDVDVLDFQSWSHGLMTGEGDIARASVEQIAVAGDLLPDWYDDWVLIERERLRQLRLHALERACVELTEAGEYGRAIEAGLAAITDEPLHESGHVALINAHLGEGNRAEAIRQYDTYARLMRDELGLEPSPRITALVAGLLPRVPAS
jgi:DNA-binding SARP family transcriptional activator